VVTLADSSVLGFDGLVIATGVSARHLPGVRGVRGVFTLRTVEDAEALRDEFSPGRELVVVGGGFLGCEVAAVARRFGMNVTVVDPLDEPLLRQLGATVASRVRRLHEENGVRMRTGVGVSSVVEAEGGVTGVRLTDGQVLAADAVLVAIGSTPNTEWLSGSGVGVTDGVEADKFCRVAPGVVAAGDVARWFHVGLGRTVRIEHRMNASEQGAAAARSLLQRSDEPFAPIPYFWSDQYDTKLQAYGIPSATADVVPVRGNLNDERFAVMYVEAGQTVGALVWNMPREALALRADVAAAYASQSTQAPV
jgi:NADPH-dependent 2,4-dienoyl-CoA reductase/sulfur reductase-like enzyme